MASLVVAFVGETKRYELRQGHNVIGRHSENPVSILQPSVSGRHAVIYVEGDECVIEDAGSRNGTFVNRHRIRGRVKLNHNDAIQFGDANARFDSPASPKQTVDGSAGTATVSDVDVGMQTIGGRLDIDDADQGMITGQVAASGRFGGLGVNPQAKLKAVLEISNCLAGTVELTVLLPKILQTLFGIFEYADRGCILLKDERTGELVPRAMQHRREDEDSTVRLSRTIVNKLLSEKVGILSDDAAADSQFAGSQSIADLHIRSMMCAPLLGLDGGVLGILSIDSQNPMGKFSAEDLEILMTVAGQAALAYENARLVLAYTQKRQQDRELEIARGVQLSLLPGRRPPFPERKEFSLDAVNQAAKIMAGDFFDYWFVEENVLAVLIADVSGKGVPAAMFMAVARTLLRVATVPGRDPGKVLTEANNALAQNNEESMFVTVFYAHYHVRSGELVFANGGHNPPYMLRANGTVESLGDPTGPIVAVMPDVEYTSRRMTLADGDTLVLYTDGVTEAANQRGEFLSESGLEKILASLAKRGVEEICRTVLTQVDAYRSSPDQDDVTVVALRHGSESCSDTTDVVNI
jgi:serine phosphatase RsbU (regulator of sigma subunit)